MLPKAPRDPEARKKRFYIMRDKKVAGSPQPDGTGVQTIYLNNDRLVSFAKIEGGISDEEVLKCLKSAEGFRRLVYGIGVSVEGEVPEKEVDFCLEMYGSMEGIPGTCHRAALRADGMEYFIKCDEIAWKEQDAVPGQIRFEFKKADTIASVSVCLYVRDGFPIPEQENEEGVDFESAAYQALLQKSLLQKGNNRRFKEVLDKAKRGERVKVAFIGGSITQGAWAIPIHQECYAYRAFAGFCEMAGRTTEDNVEYVKAGVGGTSSELGMVRYEKEVKGQEGTAPDLCVVEFAVNDEGDETGGESYDCLVRRILQEKNHPAVVLLFSVFADDQNLQERLRKVGEAYDLPMVSLKDCLVEQFYKRKEEGRIISKRQYFYDIYHPNNAGHRIMADCLLHLWKEMAQDAPDEEPEEVEKLTPPYGAAFVDLKYLDRKTEIEKEGIVIVPGDFTERDFDLQMVERNRNTKRTPEFTENWMHKSGNSPFVLELTCKALLIVEKDSGSPKAGIAEVFVDGRKVREIDPHEVGWVHCNALICLKEEKAARHRIEIAMKPGEEEKEFTILAFAYVE